MNKAPFIFLGIFFTLALSWTGIVLVNQHQLGELTPYYDQVEGKGLPESPSGMAARGKLVYQDLGCVYCHTQQVRRPGFGSDRERGWGDRQSVARDYVQENRVLLGTSRTGPDLRNIGARQTSREWHYMHLFDASLNSPGSTMPQFPFLFEQRKITGQPSPKALKLPLAYAQKRKFNKIGYEIVPTPRAEALVEYLLSLKSTYDLPEAINVPMPPPEPATAPAATPATK